MLLKGKVAIITGGSQGIGLAIAKRFARAGARIVLLARTKRDLLKVKAYFDKRNLICSIFQCDVSNPRQVARTITKIRKTHKQIDILVNNAGIYGPIGLVVNANSKKWLKTIQVNLFGYFLMTKAVLPYMMKQKKGKIINLSGGGAMAPFPHFSAYASSKAAIVRFTETVAREVKPYRIDVNSVSPGGVNTRLVGQVLRAGKRAAGHRFYTQITKQKRGGVPPEKAAELALFLASSRSDGLTGKLISAVRDHWQGIPRQIKKVTSSDVFTLRRISSKDCGIRL